MLKVIAGIDDDGQFFRRQRQTQAVGELGSAHAAAQGNHVSAHRNKSCSEGRSSAAAD